MAVLPLLHASWLAWPKKICFPFSNISDLLSPLATTFKFTHRLNIQIFFSFGLLEITPFDSWL
jgi:hypothetical protein